jgi:hypothetical protein
MKDVVLSTGQTATIRSKDELTEGQSRKIEIARSRGTAVFKRFGVESETGFTIPPEDMDKLTDEDWAQINGFSDALITEMTVTFNGGSDVLCPANLLKPEYDALEAEVSAIYAGIAVAPEGPDDKINPLVEAAASTPLSLVETQI